MRRLRQQSSEVGWAAAAGRFSAKAGSCSIGYRDPHPNPPPLAGEGDGRVPKTLPCLRGREGPAAKRWEGGGLERTPVRYTLDQSCLAPARGIAMADYDLVIRDGTVVTAADIQHCDVGIKDGVV